MNEKNCSLTGGEFLIPEWNEVRIAVEPSLKALEPALPEKAGTAALAGRQPVFTLQEGHVSGRSALSCPNFPTHGWSQVGIRSDLQRRALAFSGRQLALYVNTVRHYQREVNLRFA
jgi:hypothetical protein